MNSTMESREYAGETGTFEQIDTVTTPYGKLIIHSNIDNGTLSYETASGGGSDQVLVTSKGSTGPAPAGLYDQVISQSANSPTMATMYTSGTTYYFAVEASPGGNCNPGNDIYIVKWAAGSAPVLSQLATLDSNACIQADTVLPTKSGFAISILSGDDLKIVNWAYDRTTDKLIGPTLQAYHSESGFTPLIDQYNPVVKSVVTRYGTLVLDPNS
jgi:hypothetical protein